VSPSERPQLPPVQDDKFLSTEQAATLNAAYVLLREIASRSRPPKSDPNDDEDRDVQTAA
jgi:hypothetical protein